MIRRYWTIVAFEHPGKSKSVLYRQGLSESELLEAVKRAAADGANLMSIRGFRYIGEGEDGVVKRLSFEVKR